MPTHLWQHAQVSLLNFLCDCVVRVPHLPGCEQHSEHGRHVRQELVLLSLIVQDLRLSGSEWLHINTTL